MNDSASEKPKIIVDEDWKNQVEKEKEALQRAGAPPAPADEAPASPPDAAPEIPLPEASFAMLITTLATQAMLALGQAGMPDDKQVKVDLNMAKHYIDTLDVLEQKTKGNLADEEARLLTTYLYQLRMLFVAVRSERNQPRNSPLDTP